jgi:hypothetical protein
MRRMHHCRAARTAGYRSPGSAWHRAGILVTDLPPITARRADIKRELPLIGTHASQSGRRLDPRPSIDPEVAYTWRRTVTSRGRVRVHGLADEVGWSRKRLWSRFRSQIGLTPKMRATRPSVGSRIESDEPGA